MKQGILVVSDESCVIKAVKDRLQQEGYAIMEAIGAAKGLECLQEITGGEIDIILCDYNLEDVDGIDFLAQASEIQPNTIRVLISGYNDFKKAVRAIAKGQMDRFLTEPWDEESLIHMVDTACEYHKRLQREMPHGKTFADIPQAILVTDAKGKVVEMNDAMGELIGCEPSDSHGKLLHLIDKKKTHLTLLDEMHRSVDKQGSWAGELYIKNETKGPQRVYGGLVKIENEKKEALNYVYTLIALKDTGQASSELAPEAQSGVARKDVSVMAPSGAPVHSMDWETAAAGYISEGVLLQNQFTQYLSDYITHSAERRKIILCFIGFNRLESVNSVYGHLVGEAVVKQIGECLQKFAKHDELVGLMQGHRFALALNDPSEDEPIEAYLERLQAFFQTPFEVKHHAIRLIPNFGVSVYPQDGRSADELMRHANSALTHAMSNGTKPYQFYEKGMRIEEKNKLFIEQEIQRALTEEQFSLMYQPAMSLTDHRIVSLEALIRWEHPEFGLILPNTFLPICEETGLIFDVEKYVINRGCQALANWRKTLSEPLIISFNLSPREFAHPGFKDFIDMILKKYDLPTNCLELQLTEGVLFERLDEIESVLETLHATGVQLCLDNFGTGYASLGYLTRLPLNAIRISQAFTQNILSDEKTSTILLSILELSQKLSIQSTVLGVELEEQVHCLEQQPCHGIQGYYVSKPLQEEDVLAFVQGREAGRASGEARRQA